MKKQALQILRFLAFFAIGIFIFWLIYKDQDINRIKSILKNDVNYSWIWVSLFFSILSHISRSVRWNLMITPLGHRPRLLNTFLAVMVGYLMNLVIPRMGELSRCGVLARYEKISFAKLAGTVVVERIIDVLALLVLTLMVIISQFGYVLDLLRRNPEIEQKLMSVVTSPFLIGAALLFFIFLFGFRRQIKKSKLYKRVEYTLMHFKEGLYAFKNIEKKGVFLFHTAFIWLMYYLMLYVVFFSFGFTSGISPLAGLTTFVMGSFGMVAPVQGGIGAWHFMIIESLSLYGVAKSNGMIFAFLAHGTMTALLIVFGLLSLMVLPFVNRRQA